MANKVFSTESWASFTNKFKSMIASLRGMSDTLDTKASVIDPISVSAIASGSSTADWSSCTALVNYIRKYRGAPSTLVVTASTTVYTLMLTSTLELDEGEEWIFEYRGLGINGSGTPFDLTVILSYLYTPNMLTADLVCKELALQSVVASLQTIANYASDTASEARTTANSALSTANSASTAASSAQTTANSALSKANTNATNITSLQSTVSSHSTQINNTEELANMNSNNFAPVFSTTKSYKVGEYVRYAGGILYRCTTAHSAGAWVASHFTQVTVGEDMYVPWKHINVEASAIVSSSTPDPNITIKSTVTFPAGIYYANAIIVPLDFTVLTDIGSCCTFDMFLAPFDDFTMDCPHSWFKTGAHYTIPGVICHVSSQITVASGTTIGRLVDAKVQSGQQCEFQVYINFTRLSTH